MSQPFFGKFRGVVTDNVDPLSLGRIRAKVQDVLGDRVSGWAMPAVPYAGNGVGFFMIPPVEASVWIEFEHGAPDYPIWTGCFWAQGEVPASPAVPDTKMIKTDVGTITINDLAGLQGITIETTNGLKIDMSTTGIEISNGAQKITISAASVSINDGALEVI